MICPNCGNENPDDSRFCAYCGAPADLKISGAVPPDPARAANTYQEAYRNPYQSAPQGGDPFSQAGTAAAAGYAAASSSYDEPAGEAPTVGQWMLSIFLAAIPVVGLILMLVWGFSAGTPAAKKNWARANLIWSIIVFIVTMVFSILAALGEVSSMSYIGGLFH